MIKVRNLPSCHAIPKKKTMRQTPWHCPGRIGAEPAFKLLCPPERVTVSDFSVLDQLIKRFSAAPCPFPFRTLFVMTRCQKEHFVYRIHFDRKAGAFGKGFASRRLRWAAHATCFSSKLMQCINLILFIYLAFYLPHRMSNIYLFSCQSSYHWF